MLTEHFNLREFTRSQTATRRGIINIPNKKQIANLRRLCETVLEPLRDRMEREIHITSGYRCRRLNHAIGSKSTSQHCKGMAADIVMSGFSARELGQVLMLSDIPFDTMIIEFNSWIHVSISKSAPRHMCMRASRVSDAAVEYRLIHA